MSNETIIARGVKPRGAVAAACALGLILSGSCSTVFTASISGSIIDGEDYDDGVTTGVPDARVYLYVDEDAWEEDYADYVEGDESTLPDGGPDVLYFQSTETDADGAYQFSGFIWETVTPEYGKTADRREVYLLAYHRDYGLWKSVLPLFVVSDVTARLPDLRIEDRFSEGTIAGTVLDWADDDGLEGVTVGFYVAESWTYDAGGGFADVVYGDAPSATATTDADGYWSADVAFPMEPDRATHAGHDNAPVRVTFSRTDYRANDPDATPDFTNAGIVTSVDMDGNGKDADDRDYSDAFVEAELEVKSAGHALTTVTTVELQRWSFSVALSGQVVDNSMTRPYPGVNGVLVRLTAPSPGGAAYSDYSADQTVGDITTAGKFDLGTVSWDVDEASDKQTGALTVALNLTPTSGTALTSILPDDAVVLELVEP